MMDEPSGAGLNLTAEEVKTVRDLLNLQRALIDSVTAEQVTGAASRLSDTLPLLEALSRPATLRSLTELAGELPEIVTLLVEYHRSGTIRKALELMTILSVIVDSVGSETIARFAKTANNAILSADRLLSSLDATDAAGRVAEAAREAARKTEEDKRTLGVFGLLQALKQPSVQKALKFLLHFAAILDRPKTDTNK